ncbi:MAG: alpha-L-fucosidase [Kiritimatiellae bacterium]|nr:alpha-L-fucosidase [Kiritimatiellia bacterium]
MNGEGMALKALAACAAAAAMGARCPASTDGADCRRNLAPLVQGAVPARPEAVKRWRDLRFGMFIHWGPVSLKGTEIGWSRGKTVPVEEYDSLYKRFNPEKFNADEWVDVAKKAGMKYIVLTTKHHDGFCLWDTKETDYNIMNTPFGRDVTKELSDACRRAGIAFGAYYSTCDWHHPDFPATSPGGKTPRETHDLDRYTDYMKSQVRELLVNYGPLLCLWHDVPQKFDARRGAGVINLERAIQPDILVNNRTRHPGDFDTPEQRIGKFQLDRPWETCMTICRQWAWKPNDTMKPLDACIRALLRTIGGDGNFLFNVGPQPDGLVEPRQAERLREMGDWIAPRAEAIYGTRGGPWKPSPGLVSTRRGDRIYLHFLKRPQGPATLRGLPLEVKGARALGDGRPVKVSGGKGEVTLDVQNCAWDGIAAVVELAVDGDSMSVGPLAPFADPSIPDATASASAVYNGSDTFAPGKAIDGDETSRWATPAGTREAWLRIDFAKPTAFSGIHIEEACCGHASRVKKWELQVPDGDGWKTVFAGGKVGAHFEQSFAPVTSRAVRIAVLDATEGPTFSEVWLVR